VGFQKDIGGWPASMPDVVAAGLAGSQVRDGPDAVADVRLPDWLDGAAGTFGGGEGRRVAGVAPGGGGAAAAEPEAGAGPGGPDGDRCPDSAAPKTTADEPAGDCGHAAALAPAACPPRGTCPRWGGRPTPGSRC